MYLKVVRLQFRLNLGFVNGNLLRMYSCITDGIEITATPQYEPEQSQPDRDFYFYSYQICITNHSQQSVTILHRHWVIRDGANAEKSVQGKGVIGLQPTIEPGYAFEYTSACPLNHPYGNMRGYYLARRGDSDSFKIKIPLFFLRPPRADHPRYFPNPYEPVLH